MVSRILLVLKRARVAGTLAEGLTTSTAEGPVDGDLSSKIQVSNTTAQSSEEQPQTRVDDPSGTKLPNSSSVPKDLAPKSTEEAEHPDGLQGKGPLKAEGEDEVRPAETHAVILLPGLFQEPKDMLTPASAKICTALSRKADNPTTKFTVAQGLDEKCQEFLISRATITGTRTKKGESTSETVFCTDLYELSYKDMLVGRYKDKKPIIMILLLGWLIISNIHHLGKVVFSPAKTYQQKLQILWAVLLLILLLAYISILITSLITLLPVTTEAPPVWASIQTKVSHLSVYLGHVASAFFSMISYLRSLLVQLGLDDLTAVVMSLLGWVASLLGGIFGLLFSAIALIFYYKQEIVVVITGLGLFTALSLKEKISEASLWIMGATNYLTMGERRSAITGQVYALLEYIQEKGTSYNGIHIVGYSFGSIIAIDAIYPYTEAKKSMRRVKNFITIGCPFDFIRTFWTNYFNDRVVLEPQVDLPSWLNIYVWTDVLASDFQNHPILPRVSRPQTGEGIGLRTSEGFGLRTKEGIGLRHREGEVILPQNNKSYGPRFDLKRYSMFQKLSLLGFKVHTAYWGDPESFAPSCFDIIVEKLYKSYLQSEFDSNQNTSKTIIKVTGIQEVSDPNTSAKGERDLATIRVVETASYDLTFKNEDKVSHALRIEGTGLEVGTRNIDPNQSDHLTVDLKPGTYKIFCTVGNHELYINNNIELCSKDKDTPPYEITCEVSNNESPPQPRGTSGRQSLVRKLLGSAIVRRLLGSAIFISVVVVVILWVSGYI